MYACSSSTITTGLWAVYLINALHAWLLFQVDKHVVVGLKLYHAPTLILLSSSPLVVLSWKSGCLRGL